MPVGSQQFVQLVEPLKPADRPVVRPADGAPAGGYGLSAPAAQQAGGQGRSAGRAGRDGWPGDSRLSGGGPRLGTVTARSAVPPSHHRLPGAGCLFSPHRQALTCVEGTAT